ncbi:tumor necrosis factor receptor superfamily member 5-like [Scomber japonicus]|uniref:tumor necrosis factor receptor superfamily member 5-like n=1 Tax=Scomber japonicus TaxID=13676 RepID=UPI0023053D9C|nr:tumor necrosis factor receptor superfamily member 5-like [Scomber japonicus]
MAMILWTLVLSLFIQGCLSSVGQPESGCRKWRLDGVNVCCDECQPGNRLVIECGPDPKDLCTPCESETYTNYPNGKRCWRCTQCEGQVLVKKCTATSDTVCGCEEGQICGDEKCSFCAKECAKGHEPDKRSCRPCPDGTFNDQIHQKCKPWSTKCPNPDEVIVAAGNKISDIKCNTTVPIQPDRTNKDKDKDEWSVALFVVPSVFLMTFIIIIIIFIVTVKTRSKTDEEEKKTKKETIKTPIIRTPTDDPETLIAIECSFHEAQQEQGSSSESLASKDSSDQLIV